jgi:hypothetical protein
MAERERAGGAEGAFWGPGPGRKAFVEAALPASGAFGPAPDAADLALINERFALAPLAAEDLYVRRMVLANDALDRTYERFPPAVLERFAQTLPGKPVLVAHDKSELPIGVIYRAQVRPAREGEAGRHSLEAALYMRRTPVNAEVREQIDAGVIRAVSIGFRYDTRLCSVCGADYLDCPHDPGEIVPAGAAGGKVVTYTYAGDMARYEACECSLVYLGAQQQAGITKGAGVQASRRSGVQGPVQMELPLGLPVLNARTPEYLNARPGGKTMEYEKAFARIRELEAEVARLTDLPPGSLPAREGEMDETAVLPSPGRGGAGGEVRPADETAALAADGKAYRQHLRGEVLRLAGIVKSEAEAGLLLKALPHAPVAALQELLASYQARVEEKFPPRPFGDPAPFAARRQAGEAAGPEQPFRFS